MGCWPKSIQNGTESTILEKNSEIPWWPSNYPFTFQNFGVQEINVKVDGQYYPATPYNVDFSNEDFMDIYDDMLRSIGLSQMTKVLEGQNQNFFVRCFYFYIDLWLNIKIQNIAKLIFLDLYYPKSEK